MLTDYLIGSSKSVKHAWAEDPQVLPVAIRNLTDPNLDGQVVNAPQFLAKP